MGLRDWCRAVGNSSKVEKARVCAMSRDAEDGYVGWRRKKELY